ncbi:hypothetical protein KEM55_004183 [Ascosphaera atra]|nr:hypothetical protein KEM55_004183 [Ascosphaera atra]
MGYDTYDDVYAQKMQHWQKQKGPYEPVHIHIHHDPKAQLRQEQAASQPLPTQLLRTVLSPMSGLLGGLQNMRVPGQHYVTEAKKTLTTPLGSPTLAPSMSAQSPSPPQSPLLEKQLRDLVPGSPASPGPRGRSLHEEIMQSSPRGDSPSPLAFPSPYEKYPVAHPDDAQAFHPQQGFHFELPSFIASRPVLSSLFASMATFAGPSIFMYTFFVSATLVLALSLALPICMAAALCFTAGCALLVGAVVVLPAVGFASVLAVAAWVVGWVGYYTTKPKARPPLKRLEGMEMKFRP